MDIEQPAKSFSRLPSRPGLVSLTVALAIVNALLLVQNYSLRAKLIPKPVMPEKGSPMPTLSATTLTGEPANADSKGARKLILFTSPECQFCTAQLPKWRALVKSLSALPDADRPTIFLLSDRRYQMQLAQSQYGSEMGELPFLLADSGELERCRLTATPTTVVVSKEGIIDAVWPGLWDNETSAKIEQYFRVPEGSIPLGR